VKLRYFLAICIAFFTSHAFGQRLVKFPLQDSPVEIQADLYGSGTRGVILAHGGRFHKESWKKQAQTLTDAGFLVLAVRFRGDGPNPDGSPGSFGSTTDNAADVLAAVSYLHRIGVKTVSAVGASMGGDAVGEANAKSSPGNISRIILLGSSGGDAPKSSADASCSSSPATTEAVLGFDCPRFPATTKKHLNQRNWSSLRDLLTRSISLIRTRDRAC